MEGEKDPESFRKTVRSQTKYHFLKKQEKYSQVIWEGSGLEGVWEAQEKHWLAKGLDKPTHFLQDTSLDPDFSN